MQNNDNHKPTAEDIAGEMTAGRKSAVWGRNPERPQPAERELVRLPIEQVDPDPQQPRRNFNPKGLEELRASIESHGQLTPVFVRTHPDAPERYMLIAGERRYRVLKDLGQESIIAIVLPVSQKEAREIALIDNLQRADLSPLEEAAGYQSLMDEFHYTQEDLAKIVGKDQTVVSTTLSINKLPEKIKKDDLAQQASKSVLVELARVTDGKQLNSLWSDIKKGIRAGIRVSVRGVRGKRTGQKAAPVSPAPATPDKVVVVGKNLTRALADLTPEALATSPEQRETLQVIRDRLEELFSGLDSLSPTPESEQAAE